MSLPDKVHCISIPEQLLLHSEMSIPYSSDDVLKLEKIRQTLYLIRGQAKKKIKANLADYARTKRTQGFLQNICFEKDNGVEKSYQDSLIRFNLFKEDMLSVIDELMNGHAKVHTRFCGLLKSIDEEISRISISLLKAGTLSEKRRSRRADYDDAKTAIKGRRDNESEDDYVYLLWLEPLILVSLAAGIVFYGSLYLLYWYR